ncbi:MAG: ABC transporter substrate-binding protein [Spirochaetales bacterium]|jgi:ABC-type branched-subunit amino acid transport system substrate-binding protein|nr:ABC transporter substrate-binding protein [Spirochaetales bacterium]
MNHAVKRFGAAVICILLAVMVTPNVFAGGEKEQNPSEVKIGFMSSLTGTFAGVAEAQRRAFIYGVEKVNNEGGLNMPWGKVKLSPVTNDDEAKLDIGNQRFRDMINQGTFAVSGGVWNPLSTALNEESKVSPVVYVTGYVPAIDVFKKGIPSDCTFSAAFTPWTLGYLNGQSIIQELGKKKIYFLSRNDSWGQTIYEGLEAAVKDFGGEIVGFDGVNLGTSDFSAIINKVLNSDAEVFLFCQFGGDAIACAKQAYDMGLSRKCLLYNSYITNIVAGGLPREALDGLYGLAYFYWDSSNPRVKEFSDGYSKRWNEPPDAYGGSEYVALEITLRGAEKAGSFDPVKISEALKTQSVETIKGAIRFREDHQPIIDEASFLVRGKGAASATGQFDYFQVLKSYGGEGILPSLSYMGY